MTTRRVGLTLTPVCASSTRTLIESAEAHPKVDHRHIDVTSLQVPTIVTE